MRSNYGQRMKPQFFAKIDKLFVVGYFLRVYRTLAKVLLPQVNLLVKQGFKLCPSAELPDFLAVPFSIMNLIEGYFV
jgi:hypothetical protein